MRHLFIVTLLCCSFQPGSKTTFEKLSALKGTWQMSAAKGNVYETWSHAGPGKMKGMSYKLNGSDTIVFEHVLLKVDKNGVYYIPTTEHQNNNLPVVFTLVRNDAKGFVFENKTHDFPQRIIYQFINPDSLNARIEGLQNGTEQRQEYFYKKIF